MTTTLINLLARYLRKTRNFPCLFVYATPLGLGIHTCVLVVMSAHGVSDLIEHALMDVVKAKISDTVKKNCSGTTIMSMTIPREQEKRDNNTNTTVFMAQR